MKKSIIATIILLLGSLLTTNAQETIKLPAVDKSNPATLMQSLDQRQSIRQFSDESVDIQQLSNLLWAANGINREDSGKRTAPSAMNRQRIAIYVLTADGTYRYDHVEHALIPISKSDVRQDVRGNRPALNLVLVNEGEADRWAGVDAGYISQNIYLYCAVSNMATVACGGMDRKAVGEATGIEQTDRLLLQHPVGMRVKE